jgi:hypothetical protein
MTERRVEVQSMCNRGKAAGEKQADEDYSGKQANRNVD